jgi:putative transposase
MAKTRQHRSAQFKFQVALAALKEQKTLSQLASEYDVHPTQITQWKKQLLEGGSSLFGQQRLREQHEQTAREADLFEQIGRLKMELEWLKKKLTGSVEEKRALIEPDHPALSIRRQCALVGLNRAAYYYAPAPEDPLNLELMRRIDAQYLKTPFYGWPKMTAALRAGLFSQRQAGAAPDAPDGAASHYRTETTGDQHTGTSNLSVFVARCGH